MATQRAAVSQPRKRRVSFSPSTAAAQKIAAPAGRSGKVVKGSASPTGPSAAVDEFPCASSPAHRPTT